MLGFLLCLKSLRSIRPICEKIGHFVLRGGRNPQRNLPRDPRLTGSVASEHGSKRDPVSAAGQRRRPPRFPVVIVKPYPRGFGSPET